MNPAPRATPQPGRLTVCCALPALRVLAHGRWTLLGRAETGLGWWAWTKLNLSAAVAIRQGLVRVDGTRVQISQRGLVVLRQVGGNSDG